MPRPGEIEFSKTKPECKKFITLVADFLNEIQLKADFVPPGWNKEMESKREHFYRMFPLYRNIIRGSSGLPHRDEVLRLARYLNLTPLERNRLLVAAAYIPIIEDLKGTTLGQALKKGQELINYLPFPAYVITRDHIIQQWNDLTLQLFGMSREDADRLPPELRYVLRFIFDTTTTVYPVIRGDLKWWAYTAELNIYHLKLDNMLNEDSTWEEFAKKEPFTNFPGFAEMWGKIDIDSEISSSPTGILFFRICDKFLSKWSRNPNAWTTDKLSWQRFPANYRLYPR